MNLLFLRKKSKKIWIFLAFITSSMGLQAGDSIPDAKFLEHCKKANAYFLYHYTDISFKPFWGRYQKRTTISSKLVVNNATGVEQFAFLEFSEFISDNLKEIKVKTLKADGTVVVLDSSLIFKRKPNSKKFEAINYPIPGVEPGDTIETTFAYTQFHSMKELGSFVNLYKDIPSLNTQYSIKSKPNISIRYKGYNDFKKPDIVANDTIIYCLFQGENIKGLKTNQNTCINCDLPYAYYSMEYKNSDFRKWKDVYNEEFNIITQPLLFENKNSSYYKKWKRRLIGEAKDSSKYYKLNLLLEDVEQNMKMEEGYVDEILNSSGYFLKEKRFNSISIRRLYRQLLEDLEIEYWAVFARSKRSGKIDHQYIRKGEFDHVFFAYNNEQGTMNLLYPHDTNYKYHVNEIPTSIYNTEAVIAKPFLTKKLKKSDKFINRDLQLAEVDSVTINTIKLPGSIISKNYIRQVVYSDVDVKNKLTPIKYKFAISGGLYTELKSFITLLDKDEEASEYYDALDEYEGEDDVIKIDTVTMVRVKSIKPFTYQMSAEGSLNGVLTYLNDTMISVALDKLIEPKSIETEEEESELNYYLNFGYSDYYMLILNFPCEIEVLGLEAYNQEFKNDFGEYLFNLKLTNGNRLSIQSNYKILKDMIPMEAYAELKKLNQVLQELKNKRLIIKLKNP
ncbi:MAG: hypothetical protein COA50_07830 [Flavobacteriaceae bacterium]|nr:MAG: hypothetical protein COA50_07830 [Flavobacteriaceae bacterium]